MTPADSSVPATRRPAVALALLLLIAFGLRDLVSRNLPVAVSAHRNFGGLPDVSRRISCKRGGHRKRTHADCPGFAAWSGILLALPDGACAGSYCLLVLQARFSAKVAP